jgi:predicted nucleic acid-binding protein
MSTKAFLDTNIIIYGYSQDEPDKRQRACECAQAHESWISTQVLNETVNTLKRKFSLDCRQISAVVDELSQQSQHSYFDSLIIASALEVGCDRLYSEDLQNGQKIDNILTLINPFRDI